MMFGWFRGRPIRKFFTFNIKTQWETERQFLPRCKNCHAPHPLARPGRFDDSKCPDCGTPTGPLPEPVREAVFVNGGLILWLASQMVRLGKWLDKKAKRL